MKKNKIDTFYGKPITKLNRKELIECIELMGEEIMKYKDDMNLMGSDYYELLARKKLGLK